MNDLNFLHWFGHAEAEAEKADLIFITHAHMDHASYADIQIIATPQTMIIATPDTLDLLPVTNEY